MRVFLIVCLLTALSANLVFGQRECRTAVYQQEMLRSNPLLKANINAVENFISHKQNQQVAVLGDNSASQGVIRIPVVVHVLYHQQAENISDQQVMTQIKALNECFRRQQPDSALTPKAFKPLAADCEFEFQLAISDPSKRATTGIIHKYTPIEQWKGDDVVKSSAQMGDDAWDSENYLNIWVCNMRGVAGFSSIPGGPADKDGVVLDYTVMGINTRSGYEMGKTGVHEVGHWLGLKHIWGDENCGDDLVNDTPKQSTYSVGCPTGIRSSCDNGINGNMYMNYMDFTSDACTNLFTTGQKARMRALFAAGGVHSSLLSSPGLKAPLYSEIPLPDQSPRWMHPQLYPNPASNEVTVDISYDTRWIGKSLQVISTHGQIMLQTTINSRIQKINISSLPPGIYFIAGKKEDGECIKQKIVKM